MGEREQKLQDLGYALDNKASPKAKYVLLKHVGTLVYTSGFLPVKGEALGSPGKVPSAVDVETASSMAALCVANILAAVREAYGSLAAIKQVVKVTGFVNSEPDFPSQHLVINGASSLLLDVLGEAGAHSRSAVGVVMLPLNACVEVEVIFEMEEGAVTCLSCPINQG